MRCYADFLADYDAFRRTVVARHRHLRPFLLGHSMGGHIALAYALDHQDDLAGLVLSAPALAAPAVPRAARSALMLVARTAPTLRRAVVDLNGICSDEAVVAAYRADALVHQGHPTLGLSLALVDQMDQLLRGARELRLPLLVLHGTADRVCDPVGSRALAESAGTSDLTVRWYEGLWHELFHEPEREHPLADLRTWLDAHRGPPVRTEGTPARGVRRRGPRSGRL